MYVELGYSDTIAQAHQGDIKKTKSYLKLVVRVKTTGTSEGYNDSKKMIKESKSSYTSLKAWWLQTWWQQVTPSWQRCCNCWLQVSDWSYKESSTQLFRDAQWESWAQQSHKLQQVSLWFNTQKICFTEVWSNTKSVCLESSLQTSHFQNVTSVAFTF